MLYRAEPTVRVRTEPALRLVIATMQTNRINSHAQMRYPN